MGTAKGAPPESLPGGLLQGAGRRAKPAKKLDVIRRKKIAREKEIREMYLGAGAKRHRGSDGLSPVDKSTSEPLLYELTKAGGHAQQREVALKSFSSFCLEQTSGKARPPEPGADDRPYQSAQERETSFNSAKLEFYAKNAEAAQRSKIAFLAPDHDLQPRSQALQESSKSVGSALSQQQEEPSLRLPAAATLDEETSPWSPAGKPRAELQ